MQIEGRTAQSRAAAYDLRLVETGRMLLARVVGPLDMMHAPQFVETLKGRCRRERIVVVDLRLADFIDSSACARRLRRAAPGP